MKVYLAVLFCITLLNQATFSQSNTPTQEEPKFTNTIAVSGGFTHVPKGASLEQQATGFFLPTVGVDYLRRISPHWEIGVMLDLELAKYQIPSIDDLDRHNAVVTALVTAFAIPKTNINLFGGIGMEFETHEHLPIFRLGAEYQIKFGDEGWFVGPNVFMDYKKYDTWSLAFAVGKEF